MRHFRWFVWVLAAACAAPSPQALAQTWPAQPLKIIVGFGPGSTPDLMGRVIAEQLQTALGQPVVVENKPGAGGNIAAGDVAKASPDGYTLGVTIPGPLIVNPMIGDVSYDPKKDLQPITILGTQPSVLVVPAGLGVNNIAELVALLKKNPGKYNYASIGIGSISHLSMELIAQQSGTEMVHVPYKSSPDAVTAVATGDAHMAALAPAAVLGMAQSGKIKMLAVTTPKRWPALPDVPTFAEQGLPEVQAEAWMALIAPAKTPAPVIDRIYGEVKTALGKPDTLERMKKLSFEPVGITPAQFAARIGEEEKRWGAVVTKLGLKKK